jgi:hypothetical protein
MMSDVFLTRIWAMAFMVIVVAIVAVSSCTMHRNAQIGHMISEGTAAVDAKCAFDMEQSTQCTLRSLR